MVASTGGVGMCTEGVGMLRRHRGAFRCHYAFSSVVTTGLVPVVHAEGKWIAGTSPAMTAMGVVLMLHPTRLEALKGRGDAEFATANLVRAGG